MNANKKLVELVFKKAEEESQSIVLTHQAKYIVSTIEDQFNFNISDKTLRNYYNDIVKGKNPNAVVRNEIADYLSRFLDYDDFAAFKKDHIVIKEKSKGSKKTPQKALIGGLVVIASYFGYDSLTAKCMTWVDNVRYEKTGCEEANTIPIEERLLDNFQRVEPDHTYPFFKEDGSPNLWYGKSVNGDYEYFNNFGMHPITGKTLKEITDYMIEKHILKE